MAKFIEGDVVLTMRPNEEDRCQQLSRMFPGIENAYGVVCSITEIDPYRPAYVLNPLNKVDPEVQNFFQVNWWDASMFCRFNKNSFSNKILYM